MLKKIITGTAFISTLAFTCFAQTLPNIPDSFKNYSQNNLQEKLFVHTDRGAYLTGEILWFKIYSVDGAYNKPLSLSKVAYIDILDSKQNAVMQAKIALDAGSGSGSLFIPVSVSSGNYKLRAYTNWMKNYSPGYYFEKTITIINPQISPDAGNKKPAGNDVRFFPEGGNLISDIQSKVAFKAVGPDGKGIDFKGAIVDQKNDTVVRFAPLKFGMGHFLFTPAKNSTYKAVITTANNKPEIKDLPAIADNGYAMQLTDNGSGQLAITVSSNSNPADNVYIFVHTRQVTKLVKEAVLNNGKAIFLIDKAALNEGISDITIFNSARQPVCERLYFKRPANKLIIDAAADQPQYGGRKKVNVAVLAKNQSGSPLNANLSMSVYRADGLQAADQGDILSYLWLSSDLQGAIQSPGYYFANTDAGADEAADNLMLTQGWRRFEWSNVLSKKPAAFNFLPETYGHLITGTIVNNTTNAPASGIVTYLGVPGKRVQVFTAKSDSLGRLFFNTKELYGGEIVVQTNSKIDSVYRIDILRPFSEKYSQTQLPAFTIDPATKEAVEARSLGMQVQNIYAGDKIKQFYEPRTDSSGFYYSPGHRYQLDDYTRFTTMEEVLREYVKEVNIVRPQNKFHIKILGAQSYLNDPMVLVDGIPLFDADKLMAMDPLSIKSLEVVPQRYFYGPSTMEGILSFTSYKGNLGGLEIDPHAIVVDYEGLQMQRTFYSPVYDTDSQARSRVPDFRNLLFWSPSVNSNSKNAVSFYTSDQEGRYIGIVQGITAAGEAASNYFSFEVKK